MSLLESDRDSAASDGIGGSACVRVVQMLWGHLIYDCRLSDLDHWKFFVCQSGQKQGELSCALTNTGMSHIYSV